MNDPKPELQYSGLVDTGGGWWDDYTGWDKYHSESEFWYRLWEDGTLMILSTNEYGQLGDGTEQPYTEKYWILDLPFISDFYYNGYGDCFAIDDEDNLWVWGRSYASTPTILFNIIDFLLYG